MRKTKKYFSLLLAFTIAVLELSCFAELQEPILPEWDVALTIPLVKEYTLGELTDKMEDSKLFFDPAKDSQIFYRNNLSINPISINNPEYIELNSSQVKGKITISDFDFSLKENLSFESKIIDYLPTFPLNVSTVIPPFAGISSSKEIVLSSFYYISIKESDLKIEITNGFPIDLILSNVTLTNNLTGKISEIIKKDYISIAKNSSVTLIEKISAKEVYNSLKLSLSLSSPGSNELPVMITANNFLRITFNPENINIQSAEASFDEQNFNFTVSGSLANWGNQIQINEAKIKNGKLGISLFNHSALSGKLKSQLPELTNNSYVFSTGDLSVPAKGMVSKDYYISGYSLKPKNYSDINFNNLFVLNSTNNNFVKINASDSISYLLEMKDIELESFSGHISGDIKQSFTLPKEDIDKYFNGNIMLQEVYASLYVMNGSGLPFLMKENVLSGYNETLNRTESMTINDAAVSPLGKTKIDIDTKEFTGFINKFTITNSLPDRFNYNTKIDLTTNNQNYIFSNKDTISGYVELRIPLHFSISNLSYRDSVDIDISQSDKDELQNLNYGKLTIKALNGIPAEGILKLIFSDSTNRKSLTLPRNSAGISGYRISSSDKNSTGYSTKSTESIITEELSKDDINFLINAKKCVMDVLLNTSSGSPSFLKRDDRIKLNLITEFGYRIKSE